MYSNDAVGFSIAFPSGWNVESPAEMEQAAEAGHRAIYGEDVNAAEEHQRAEKILIRLVAATPPQNASSPDTSGVQIIVVPRSRLSPQQQKNFSAEAILQNPALIDVPLVKARQVTIAGTQFATAGEQLPPLTIAGHSVPVYIALYVTIRGEYALVVGITAQDAKEAADVAKVLERFHFSSPPADH